MRIVGSAELIFPMPEKWRSNARVSAFYDIGNVFYEGNGARFTDKGGFPIDYSFDTSNLKSSVGVAVQWLAPLGLFRFSFGVPLNDEKGNELLYGDETEQFQFSIGQAF
jgi:outer membrane protein insertion porin family